MEMSYIRSTTQNLNELADMSMPEDYTQGFPSTIYLTK